MIYVILFRCLFGIIRKSPCHQAFPHSAKWKMFIKWKIIIIITFMWFLRVGRSLKVFLRPGTWPSCTAILLNFTKFSCSNNLQVCLNFCQTRVFFQIRIFVPLQFFRKTILWVFPHLMPMLIWNFKLDPFLQIEPKVHTDRCYCHLRVVINLFINLINNIFSQ